MMINPNMILNAVYPVGSLYLTTNDINPSTFLGGTWEKITSDAYLKIVDSNAGSLGGTSEYHKIPVESIPNHKHTGLQGIGLAFTGQGSDGGGIHLANGYEGRISTGTTGGSQAYYPYYYGIYVFRRTA